jgi:hypothetical protein
MDAVQMEKPQEMPTVLTVLVIILNMDAVSTDILLKIMLKEQIVVVNKLNLVAALIK